MKRTDVLIIGGSAAGLVAGLTAKSNYPEKDITLIRKEEKVMIPCGIPYIYGTVGTSEKNVLGDAGLVNLGVNIVVDEVISINKEEKTCTTKSGQVHEYGKLIISTGSQPSIPKWLKGADLDNVFNIPKDKVYLDNFQSKLKGINKIAVIGAGFIGVELSDELNKLGKEIILIEALPHILGMAFDEELAIEAEELLKERGVNLKTGVSVKELTGNGKVEKVLLNNGEMLNVDAVVLSVGYRPNTKLAESAGLPINELGFIKVDRYGRTEFEDIFAAGDCAEKRDFTTCKPSRTMLASGACAQARTAALNLYSITAIKSFPGTVGIFATSIGGTSFGAAGLTETVAKKGNFDVVVGNYTAMDRHPGNLEDAHKQTVKLIASKDSGIILGGEVIGGNGTGELMNTIGFLIQHKSTITDLLTSQIGTHPLLTASPAVYPLIMAAEVVLKKMRKCNKK